ncbi:MAG TPA: response regulator transcription factor [Solirubrobacteraceae bacterium]|nr:response regulator transcription factor [Solirubrobacteraceae bacterium]
MSEASRILLADDHALLRQGLRLIIEREPDLTVVAEAADGRQAIEQASEHRVDLAILDVSMPVLNGLGAARELRRQLPTLRILMLSMHDNEEFFLEALQAGADGYLLKSAVDYQLIDACRAALRGEAAIFAGGARTLIRDYLNRNAGDDRHEELSPRELEILQLIAEGHSGRQIAEHLTISEKTVERHRSNILAKLNLTDRVQLTRYAIRRGIIEA